MESEWKKGRIKCTLDWLTYIDCDVIHGQSFIRIWNCGFANKRPRHAYFSQLIPKQQQIKCDASHLTYFRCRQRTIDCNTESTNSNCTLWSCALSYVLYVRACVLYFMALSSLSKLLINQHERWAQHRNRSTIKSFRFFHRTKFHL